MSKRDPSVENAVNLNFNDSISDNVLNVVNMSATTPTYSQYSENIRNFMHLYAPELTRAFDTTPTSTSDGTRTKPMSDIFIKTIKDEDTEFPISNSPPTTDPLAYPHGHYQRNYQRHFGQVINNGSSTVADTDKISLALPGHQKLRCHTHQEQEKYPFFSPTLFSNSKTAAPTSCNPFYFIPISEKAHKLCPTLINSDDYKISSTKCNTSHIN
jgi:hypothetical protein